MPNGRGETVRVYATFVDLNDLEIVAFADAASLPFNQATPRPLHPTLSAKVQTCNLRCAPSENVQETKALSPVSGAASGYDCPQFGS